jgi:hypothetical protein
MQSVVQAYPAKDVTVTAGSMSFNVIAHIIQRLDGYEKDVFTIFLLMIMYVEPVQASITSYHPPIDSV